MRRIPSLPLFEIALIASFVFVGSIMADLASRASVIATIYDKLEHRVTLYNAERVSDAEFQRRVDQ